MCEYYKQGHAVRRTPTLSDGIELCGKYSPDPQQLLQPRGGSGSNLVQCASDIVGAKQALHFVAVALLFLGGSAIVAVVIATQLAEQPLCNLLRNRPAKLCPQF
jgi:hypothetical protein